MKFKWKYDEWASVSYNKIGALEITLMNLGIVQEDKQWDIEELEKYLGKHKESDRGYKTCYETGGTIYGEATFAKMLEKLRKNSKRFTVNFGSTRTRSKKSRDASE